MTFGCDMDGYGATLHDTWNGGLSTIYDQLMEAYKNA